MPTYNNIFSSIAGANAMFDFLGADGGLLNSTASGQRMVWLSGNTGSNGVGPSSAQSGSHYIYMEASSPTAPGQEGYMTWKEIEGESVDSITFYANRRGNTMGSLVTQYEENGVWLTADTLAGLDIPSGGTDIWRLRTVNFPTGTLKFRIVWRMPLTGSIWNSDMGVDNITIQTSPLQVYNITGTVTDAATGQLMVGEPVILLKDNGSGLTQIDQTVTNTSGEFSFNRYNTQGCSVYVGPTNQLVPS